MRTHTHNLLCRSIGVLATGISLICSGVARAQNDPSAGIQPFSTNQFGVDLASGNINLSIPLRSKSTMSVNLVGNYHVFVDQNTNAVSSNVSLVSTASSLLGYRVGAPQASTSMTCKGQTGDTRHWVFSIVDKTGAQHPLPGTFAVDNVGYGCLLPPPTVDTIDNSGLTVVTQGLVDWTKWIIYDSGGNNVSAGAVTTPDGLVIASVSGNTYSDALSSTPVLVASTSKTSAADTYYYYDDINGTSKQTITVNKTGYYQQTAFNCPGYPDIKPTTISYYPTTINTPTGTYGLSYEPTPGQGSSYITGRLQSIAYPTGASTTYQYSGGNNGSMCGTGLTPILKVTLNDGAGHNFPYTFTTSSVATSTNVVESDPASNQTVYIFIGEYQTEADAYQGGCPTSITGCLGGGTLLRSLKTCYNGSYTNCGTSNYVMGVSAISQIDEYTTLGGMSQSSRVTKYYDHYGNVSQTAMYDFGAATPTLTIDTPHGTYQTGSGCGSIGNYIYNRPCWKNSWAGNVGGTLVSSTNFTYDSLGHLTSKSDQVNVTGTATYLKSTLGPYNANGTVTAVKDVNLASTTYKYDGTSGCNGLLPTLITQPLGISTTIAWDCNGGVQTSSTDSNGKSISTDFSSNGADPLYRPKGTIDQLGNETFYRYQTLPPMVESKLTFNGTQSVADQVTYMDGLGRTTTQQRSQGPKALKFDTVSTTYDTLGRLNSLSMPCSVSASSNCPASPATATLYDALGRPTSVTDGGGGSVSYIYTGQDVQVIVGPPPARKS
jgi:YD repeat-containing protein